MTNDYGTEQLKEAWFAYNRTLTGERMVSLSSFASGYNAAKCLGDKRKTMIIAIAEFIAERNADNYVEMQGEPGTGPFQLYGTNEDTIEAYLNERGLATEILTELVKIQK